MDAIKTLKTDLISAPTPSLIYAARWIVGWAEEFAPAWVHALANGNIEHWEDVIDAARTFLTADEMEK